jgi:transcription-repair coupling factor (superfamily II helicase)
MSDFSSIINNVKSIFKSNNVAKLSGVDFSTWSFIYFNFFKKVLNFSDSDVFVFRNEEQAEKAYESLKQYQKEILFFPGLSDNPFSSIIQSEAALYKRQLVLQSLVSNPSAKRVIVTTYSAMQLKLPPKEHFQKSFKIEISDIISPEDLALKLSSFGYSKSPTVEEPGVFSKKGEIFDIFPLDGDPVRLLYFDDMIEEIFKIDKDTLKTLKDFPVESLSIAQSPQGIVSPESMLALRSQLPKYPPAQKLKNKTKSAIFQKLSQNMLFENYPLFFPLFFETNLTFKDFLNPDFKFHYFEKDISENQFSNSKSIFEDAVTRSEEDPTDEEVFPQPAQIYNFTEKQSAFQEFNIDEITVNVDLNENFNNTLDLHFESTKVFLKKFSTVEPKNKFEYLHQLIKAIESKLGSSGKLYILYRNESSKSELEFLIAENMSNSILKSKIAYFQIGLKSGFYYKNENTFFLSESDLFAEKIKKTRKSKKMNTQDMFAEQLSTLKIGDYLIHKTHGVGKYLGMENIKMGTQENDFIIIEYKDNDKVYLPVYKLNLIQKHANQITEQKVDSLKTKKFEQAKSKARSSVKKLAFDILELNAKRKLRKGFSFSPPDHLFKEFELDFPFEETPDQLSAIDDVLDDMQKETPMDRLICGDVGFGKTEVAMRASFKAVLDKKQVSILVPTTVLAYQHFNTFTKRFEGFAVNIEYVSRFKSATQVKEILQRVEEGKVDILIGTHKLLSDKIKYKDLGLIIIDEEQRFGVAHKEKLKLLKASVDNLVMTATPIPRTLQMSFLGIRELSLIRTAPLKRQSIKTYIIKDDGKTVRDAIEKELSRGGQIFIVHNRVNDIEEYAASIKKLVPDANLIVAHGQMPERELEKRIKDFYEHKYDILVSTTIIESGIDIPAANTMIIDRADTYGLSQLHQLRGRIGRSDRKAYAYFLVPSNRNLSTLATKRLKALQTYADMGSGFALATSDLEIRGSGDILGAEQSGHIANIGLELYMELLQESIEELKGQPVNHSRSIEIQTPFPSYLPNKFIEDTGLRLKYYKRLSNCKSHELLDEIISEIEDQFGLSPVQAQNLYLILKSRINLQHLALDSIKVLSKSIILNFNQLEIAEDEALRSKVIQFFMERPKVYKLNPNFSVNCSFKDGVQPETLLEFTNYIAQQIDPC